MRVAVRSNYSRRANKYLIQSLLGFVYVTSYPTVFHPFGGKNGRDILGTRNFMNCKLICIFLVFKWHLMTGNWQICLGKLNPMVVLRKHQGSTRRLLTYAPLV